MTDEWKTFRIDVLIRDNFTCQSCHKSYSKNFLLNNSIYFNNQISVLKPDIKNVGLQVHHKLYRLNKSPWEYSLSELESLCGDCHANIHQSTKIPILDDNNQIFGYADTCTKCNGYGWISEYSHVQNGICFECWGEGIDLNKSYLW